METPQEWKVSEERVPLVSQPELDSQPARQPRHSESPVTPMTTSSKGSGDSGHEDGNDEEDEDYELLHFSPFTSSDKRSSAELRGETQTQPQPPAFPTSPPRHSERTPEAEQDDSGKDDEKLKRDAQAYASKLDLHYVDKVDSINDLAWWIKSSKSATSTAYPCRIVRKPDQYPEAYRGHETSLDKQKRVVVQYLGNFHCYVGKFDMFSEQTLVPMVLSRYIEDASQALHPRFDELMSLYLKSVKSQKLFCNKFDIFKEEMALRELIKRVKEKGEQKVDELSLFLRQDHSTPRCEISDKRAQVNPPTICDSDSESSGPIYEPGARRSKPILRAGDTIQYLSISRDLRTSTVLSIDTTSDFPLNVDPHEFLSWDALIKRTKYLRNGILVSNPRARFVELRGYKCVNGGCKDSQKGRKLQTQKLTKIWNDIKDNDYGEDLKVKNDADLSEVNNSSGKGVNDVSEGPISAGPVPAAPAPALSKKLEAKESSGERTKQHQSRNQSNTPPESKGKLPVPKRPVADKSTGAHTPKRKKQRLSSIDNNANDGAASPKIDCGVEQQQTELTPESTLDELIQIVKSNMNTRRRYKPHMTVDQLELAKKVWGTIGGASRNETVVKNIADSYNVTYSELMRFMEGDMRKTMRPRQIEEIEEALMQMMSDRDRGQESALVGGASIEIGDGGKGKPLATPTTDESL